MVDAELVREIRESKRGPLIGVIGATSPRGGYRREVGVDVGYRLRQYVGSNGGTVFTGGVSGVGVDVYIGVTRFCIQQREDQTDMFFVLVPQTEGGVFLDRSGAKHVSRNLYDPPGEYTALASVLPGRSLDIVTAGIDMEERREYMPHVGDFLIAVNGGLGTLDEAYHALKADKRVIALAGSGGAADELVKARIRGASALKRALKILTREVVDTNLILTARNPDELVEQLYRLAEQA